MNKIKFKKAAVVLVVGFIYLVSAYRFDLYPMKILRKFKKSLSVNVISSEYGLSGSALLSELQKGGYIIYFRHAEKKSVGNLDGMDYLYGVSSIQIRHDEELPGVCLTKHGKVESWFVGKIIKQLKIPVGEVITSPICRCVQTAQIAFGRVDKTDVNLVYSRLQGPLDKKVLKKKRYELFTTPILKNKNKIIVAHKKLRIKELGLHVELDQPEAAIFKIVNNKAHLVAKMDITKWAKLFKPAIQIAKRHEN